MTIEPSVALKTGISRFDVVRFFAMWSKIWRGGVQALGGLCERSFDDTSDRTRVRTKNQALKRRVRRLQFKRQGRTRARFRYVH